MMLVKEQTEGEEAVVLFLVAVDGAVTASKDVLELWGGWLAPVVLGVVSQRVFVGSQQIGFDLGRDCDTDIPNIESTMG